MSEMPSETEQRRLDRNERRRARTRAEGRLGMARHAALELITWEAWKSDDDPGFTPEQIVAKTTALYGNYRQIKGDPITHAEAVKALDEALQIKGLA